MANFLIDRLISLGVSRIYGVPGDYNLEFLELLVLYEIDRVLQACWQEKRSAHRQLSSDICRSNEVSLAVAISVQGQKRRFKSLPATSGRPPSTDIIRPVRLVRLAQEAEIARTANATWPSDKTPSLPHKRRRNITRRANQQKPVQPR
jgi:hypothetical protein